MLKLKLQYFGHLMRITDSLEKTLMLGKIEGRRRRAARASSVPSIRRQNASGRLWAKAPMAGGGAGFVV